MCLGLIVFFARDLVTIPNRGNSSPSFRRKPESRTFKLDTGFHRYDEQLASCSILAKLDMAIVSGTKK